MPRRWMMISSEKPLEVVEFALEAPGPGEVIVKIAGCGVCHTDLGFYFDGVRTNLGSVANFGRLRMNALRWTQLSSERSELLECRLARRLELSLVDHVRDFDAI